MMFIGMIIFIAAAFCAGTICVLRAVRQMERQKCYDAAYRILKEECLDRAIRSSGCKVQGGQKIMLYLKWKDSEKQGYVFDLENPVFIGRDLEANQICVREETVSARHCVFYLYQGTVYLGDLHSRNGTWLRRGFRKQQVSGACPVVSGDRLLIGGISVTAAIFAFDMTYM